MMYGTINIKKAPLILIPSVRWGFVCNATLRPLYQRKRDPVPILLEAVLASVPVWTGVKERKFLVSSGFQTPNIQSISSRNISVLIVKFVFRHSLKYTTHIKLRAQLSCHKYRTVE